MTDLDYLDGIIELKKDHRYIFQMNPKMSSADFEITRRLLLELFDDEHKFLLMIGDAFKIVEIEPGAKIE